MFSVLFNSSSSSFKRLEFSSVMKPFLGDDNWISLLGILLLCVFWFSILISLDCSFPSERGESNVPVERFLLFKLKFSLDMDVGSVRSLTRSVLE